jgi:hypothetical protein
MDELLIKQHTISDGHDTSFVKNGTIRAQSFSCPFSDLPDSAKHISCVSRFTPRNCALSTHWSGSPRIWTGLGFRTCPEVLAKSIIVPIQKLIATCQYHSQHTRVLKYVSRQSLFTLLGSLGHKRSSTPPSSTAILLWFLPYKPKAKMWIIFIFSFY